MDKETQNRILESLASPGSPDSDKNKKPEPPSPNRLAFNRIMMHAHDQEQHDGQRQFCPRCGKYEIRSRLRTNAMSRRVHIYIYDECGAAEALETAPGRHTQLFQWAAASPVFRAVKPGPGKNEPDPAACGDERWAWQYEWPSGLPQPMLKMPPVRGMLAATDQAQGSEKDKPAWFVPYAKGSKKPAWTKALRLEAVNLCKDEAAAKKAYNAEIRLTMDRFQGMLRAARQDISHGRKPGTAATAGISDEQGRYGWACVVISGGATAVVSGSGKEPYMDDYQAELIALEIAAKSAEMQGITELEIWPADAGIADSISHAGPQLKTGGSDYFDNGVAIKNPPPKGSHLDAKMSAFRQQAEAMAKTQLEHAAGAGNA